MPFENLVAKEAREIIILLRKAPRLLFVETYKGLQCGLSGDLALHFGNFAEADIKGNRLFGNKQVTAWEILLDLKPQD